MCVPWIPVYLSFSISMQLIQVSVLEVKFSVLVYGCARLHNVQALDEIADISHQAVMSSVQSKAHHRFPSWLFLFSSDVLAKLFHTLFLVHSVTCSSLLHLSGLFKTDFVIKMSMEVLMLVRSAGSLFSQLVSHFQCGMVSTER